MNTLKQGYVQRRRISMTKARRLVNDTAILRTSNEAYTHVCAASQRLITHRSQTITPPSRSYHNSQASLRKAHPPSKPFRPNNINHPITSPSRGVTTASELTTIGGNWNAIPLKSIIIEHQTSRASPGAISVRPSPSHNNPPTTKRSS